MSISLVNTTTDTPLETRLTEVSQDSYSRQLLSNKVSPVLINPARKTGVSFALNRTTIPSPRAPQQSPVQAKNKIKCKKKKEMPHTSTLVTVVFLRIRTRDSSRYMLEGVL